MKGLAKSRRIVALAVLAYLKLAYLNSICVAQDRNESRRLEIVQEIQDIFNNKITLSNEEIVKKYLVEGNYFKNDSVKRRADWWMDNLRVGFKLEEGFRIVKYTDHEDEFRVWDKPLDEEGTMQKMKFALATPNRTMEKINMDDLYVIITRIGDDEGHLFILFNDKNQIISFACITIGYHTTLLQF